MFFARQQLIMILIIGMLLASCGGQTAAGEPTPDVNATVAAGAQTMVASVFQTQTAAAPTVTNTSIPTVTVTAGPSSTPLALPSPFASATQGVIFFASATPTGTFFTPTPNPNTLSYGCNNLQLIRSYTEPEGPFKPGQEFTQKWQVANTGTCDWLYLYHLVHSSGERLGGNGGRLSNKIEPGKWTTLSVDLDAPNSAGTYSGNWRFAHADGTPFGSVLPVSIRVERNPDPTNTSPAPTSTNTSPAPTNTPNLQQTLDAVNTAIACQTNIAGGTPPPCP
ncbi:MAG TPA: NBR1-Ig-like domain-containing protein [Anaerolineales bacterium]|nr:NBR1-Ig-like domain-containing protein [Anaerolineales bacterium]